MVKAAARSVVITPRDVAEALCCHGYVTATLPRREEDLTVAIAEAFAGSRIRLGDLPARKCDLVEIRQQVELLTREAERVGRSLECARYRPAFMGTVGGEQ